jgi:hypothetical protein
VYELEFSELIFFSLLTLVLENGSPFWVLFLPSQSDEARMVVCMSNVWFLESYSASCFFLSSLNGSSESFFPVNV